MTLSEQTNSAAQSGQTVTRSRQNASAGTSWPLTGAVNHPGRHPRAQRRAPAEASENGLEGLRVDESGTATIGGQEANWSDRLQAARPATFHRTKLAEANRSIGPPQIWEVISIVFW